MLSILLLNKTYFATELKKFGHNIFTAAAPGNEWQQKFDFYFHEGMTLKEVLNHLEATSFKPDRIVYFDDSAPSPHLLGMEEVDIPILFYSVDAHIHHLWHSSFSMLFDKVLLAQKDYLEEYKVFSQNSEWFPLWAPIFVESKKEKTIDVCFRGSLDPRHRARRIKFLEEIGKHVPVDKAWTNYVDGFSKAKIIINEALEGDLNFRVFEAMMCGGLLLTPLTENGLTELFIDKKHLVTYEPDNAEDAIQKIKYYLEHESERAAIARQGRDLIMEKHTEVSRAAELANHLFNLRKKDDIERYLGGATSGILTATALETKTKVNVKNALRAAMKNLIKIAEKRELITPEFVRYIEYCKVKLEENNLHQEAAYLVNVAANSYPENQELNSMLQAIHLQHHQ